MEIERKGNPTNKEACEADHDIGFDKRSGESSNWFKIHHSRNRTHVVPMRKENEIRK